jgi:hypothetical protein
MARRLIHPHSPEIMEAVRAFGIDPNDVRSIDVHIDMENVPTITITVMPKATDAPKIADLLTATAAGRRDVNILPAKEPTCGAQQGYLTAQPCVLRQGHVRSKHEDRFGHMWPVTPADTSTSTCEIREVPAGLPCVLRWGHDSLSHEDQNGHRWPV